MSLHYNVFRWPRGSVECDFLIHPLNAIGYSWIASRYTAHTHTYCTCMIDQPKADMPILLMPKTKYRRHSSVSFRYFSHKFTHTYTHTHNQRRHFCVFPRSLQLHHHTSPPQTLFGKLTAQTQTLGSHISKPRRWTCGRQSVRLWQNDILLGHR